MDSTSSGQGSVAGCFEDDNEFSSPLIDGEYLDQLRDLSASQ
jgi:hypothetical protein